MIASGKRWLLGVLVALCVAAQQTAPASVPDRLRAPADQKLLLEAHGVGEQIYVCKTTAENEVWALKGPEAKLLGSNHQLLGHHFAGPRWEWSDGSRILGKATSTVASPDSNAVPWLRLDVIAHEAPGSLSGVMTVQRLNTQGGKAPATGCDQARAGTEARVPYQADYFFYGKPN